jgi:hypothetical protein
MLLHVLSACIREVLSIRRRSSNASRIFHHTHRQPHRRGSIAPDGLDGSWRHLLEADNERAVDRSGSDEGAGECKSRRSRRASVVCIVYRYSAALYVIFSSCDLNVYSVHRLLFSKTDVENPWDVLTKSCQTDRRSSVHSSYPRSNNTQHPSAHHRN